MTFKTISKTVHVEGGAEIGASISLAQDRMDIRITRDDIEIGHISIKSGNPLELDHALNTDLDELEQMAAETVIGYAIAALLKD